MHLRFVDDKYCNREANVFIEPTFTVLSLLISILKE